MTLVKMATHLEAKEHQRGLQPEPQHQVKKEHGSLLEGHLPQLGLMAQDYHLLLRDVWSGGHLTILKQVLILEKNAGDTGMQTGHQIGM